MSRARTVFGAGSGRTDPAADAPDPETRQVTHRPMRVGAGRGLGRRWPEHFFPSPLGSGDWIGQEPGGSFAGDDDLQTLDSELKGLGKPVTWPAVGAKNVVHNKGNGRLVYYH